MCALQLSNGSYHKFDSSDFRNGLSHVLMSYEFSLISMSVIRVLDTFPHLLCLGHFHDGVTIYIPHTHIKKSDGSFFLQKDILDLFNKELSTTVKHYKLGFNLLFEVKISF